VTGDTEKSEKVKTLAKRGEGNLRRLCAESSCLSQRDS